jgi:hypothetical protein
MNFVKFLLATVSIFALIQFNASFTIVREIVQPAFVQPVAAVAIPGAGLGAAVVRPVGFGAAIVRPAGVVVVPSPVIVVNRPRFKKSNNSTLSGFNSTTGSI